MENHKTIKVGITPSFLEYAYILCITLAWLLPVKGISSVGTPNGSLSVNDVGAAVYNVPFEIYPSGTGFDPEIGLVYNSQQAGYGNAGYGVSITGISCISRTGKDRFHDNEVQRIRYEAGDNYILDGKRLYLKSGSKGMDGSTYTVEGNPFATVTLHGEDSKGNYSMWFELQDADGVVYQYTQCMSCYFGHPSKTSQNVAWYITLARNKYGDQISYSYTQSGNVVYPSSIIYGRTGEEHSIAFSYAPLDSPQPFIMEGGTTGSISMRLSSVTAKCKSDVYRKYVLYYNTYSDASVRRFDRLTSINLQNGQGESLQPITFQWKALEGARTERKSANVSTQAFHSGKADEGESFFFSADMDNDGVDDVIRIWEGEVYDYYINADNWSRHREARIYVSRSQMDDNGNVTFQSPSYHNIPITIDLDKVFGKDARTVRGSSAICNIDGDELGDIVLPYYDTFNGNSTCAFAILRGSSMNSGNTSSCTAIRGPLESGEEVPLFCTLDLDADGKDEILCIEQKRHQNRYYGKILYDINVQASGVSILDLELTYSLDKDVKKMMLADCNADGLQDVILLFEGGYKIYFNNGGSDMAGMFTESNTKEVASSYTLKDYWRIEQGDFNGDGLVDFVVNTKGKAEMGYLLNNGDGTFSVSEKTVVDFADETASDKDDFYFAVCVADFDKDGMSDVMVSKKHLEKHGGSLFEGSYYRQDKTQVRWFRSDGTKPVLWKTLDKGAEERDCAERYIFTGDLNGDGYAEIASYGSPLTSDTDNTFTENTINIYSFPTDVSLGRVSKITNGFGKESSISYANGTCPGIYSQGVNVSLPNVNTYTLPIPLVSSVSQTNGAAPSENVSYRYEGLKIHLHGRGLLGFTSVTSDNPTLGTETVKRVTGWDTVRLLPSSVTTTTHNSGKTSTSVASMSAATDDSWNGNYFTYIGENTTTDFDGYETRSTSVYDTTRGVPSEECVYYDGRNDMYKKTQYTSYTRLKGKYIPTSVIYTQKHKDDSNVFTETRSYTYNDDGDIISEASSSEYDGDIVSLGTAYTRDRYGNILSKHTTGTGVTDIYEYTEYDNKKLRAVRTYTMPASTVITYGYDTQGNVIAVNDVTDPSHPITTSYTYDNWGRKVSTTNPDNTVTSTAMSWDSSRPNGVYKTVTSATGQAAVTSYFDSEGHELLSSSYGVGNVQETTTTTYNIFGKPSTIHRQSGKLTIGESHSYDSFGRLTSMSGSNGTTSYTYQDGRTVTAASPTGTVTRTYDAWGHVVSCETEGLSADVSYTYNSMGKPASVSCGGSTVTMEYDGAGRKTQLDDPDAGTQTYVYSADGKLMSQTDGNGITTAYEYDAVGRQTRRTCGQSIDETTTYGTSGNTLNRIASRSCNGYTSTFEYDEAGRLTGETRTTPSGTYTTSYTYNANGMVGAVAYPGGVTVTYEYDANGNMTRALANGVCFFEQAEYDGLRNVTRFGSARCRERLYSDDGFTAYRTIETGNGDELDRINYTYDNSTKNVVQRWRGPITGDAKVEWDNYFQNGGTEDDIDTDYWSNDWWIYKGIIFPDISSGYYSDSSFDYDSNDRLISAAESEPTSDTTYSTIEYDDNGNILYKGGIGTYHYGSDRPHAVTDITGIEDMAAVTPQLTTFNDDGKIEMISDTHDGSLDRTYFYYGPGREKWETLRSVVADGGDEGTQPSCRHFYFGNYERIVEGSSITEQYFLDNGVILIKKDGLLSFYKAFTDIQGSILSVFDEDGVKVFDASYDAWGRQTVTLNTINLRRGYCGHEMLPEYGLIDMRGRVYDPTVGRFLSCDNYVQEPDNSQNFNRYSYCLNNPLRYTDPTGEFWNLIIGAAIGGVINWASHGFKFNAQGLGYFATGAAAGAVGIGIAGGVNVAMAGGNFWTGAAGMAQGVASTGFWAGAASGASSGFAGGFILGAGNSWAEGYSFGSGLVEGLKSGGIGALSSGVAGGLLGGMDALDKGISFWTGKAKFDLNGAFSYVYNRYVINSCAETLLTHG
ncbi:MAG: FG-GAP-like repeat-containing protein [Bacteroidales bacterium]|nr:FG-GAP-like repeat-containing protein [Bacteroidales bacterium]